MMAGVPVDRRGLARRRASSSVAGLDRGIAWPTPSGWPSGSTPVRAVRGPLAFRPGHGREQLPAGRRCDPRLPRGEPAVASRGRRAPRGAGRLLDRRGSLVSCRPVRRRPPAPTGPHSSRGPGHRPLKAETTGSNPVCGTNSLPIHPARSARLVGVAFSVDSLDATDRPPPPRHPGRGPVRTPRREDRLRRDQVRARRRRRPARFDQRRTAMSATSWPAATSRSWPPWPRRSPSRPRPTPC